MGKVRDTVLSNIRVIVDNEKSAAEFARNIGVSRQNVSNWLSGVSAPDIEVIARIASTYNIPLSVLLEEDLNESEIRLHAAEWADVPLFGSIAAGKPIYMDKVDNYFAIPATLRRRFPDAFLLKVEGESMNRILPNGSYALINPTSEVVNGRAYAVCVNGYDATIKRVNKLANGFELQPDSTDPTIKGKVYDYGEEGTETITVIGEVVWYVVPFDFDI